METTCYFHQGELAVALAPQSLDLGHHVEWVPVCGSHNEQDWWDGSDWGPVPFKALEQA